MTDHGLPRSAPSTQGVDAGGVLAFVDALEASPDVDPHALVLVRHGHVVARGAWAPYAPDRPRLLYSLSKTFTGTALALAVGEGLVDLDDPVLSHLPELDAVTTDPRSRSLRVRHVATMSAGHLDEALDAAIAADPTDWVRGFLSLSPERDPGAVFAYSQPATLTLAAVLQRVTGQSLTAYLRPRLLDPLGVGEVAWHTDPLGRELGFSGLHASADDVARLGLLHLQDGVWAGRRLLPAGWVAEASRAHVSTAPRDAAGDATGDWAQGYGVQLWRSRHGYRGDGAFGQFCVVLPEHDAVLVLTTQTEDMQQVLDLAWRHLLPALHDTATPVDGDADHVDAVLAARMEGLQRPTLDGATHPPDPAAWDGVRLSGQGPVSRLQLRHVGPRWWADLRLWDEDLVVDLGPPTGDDSQRRWARSDPPLADGRGPVPVAVSGGWTDDGAFALELLLLDTPHSLEVRAAAPDAPLTSRWRTTPLAGRSVADLRAPPPVP